MLYIIFARSTLVEDETIGDGAPDILRTVYLIPVIATLAALGLERLFQENNTLGYKSIS